MPHVEIKHFKVLIDNKPSIDQPVKEKQETYHQKLVLMSRNNDYTTRNLLDYSYRQNYYKDVRIDLARQTYKTIPQQISFTKK